MAIRFVDTTISERVRIITEDRDPIHVYEIISKHYGESVELLKKKFDISIDFPRRFINFNSEDLHEICELVNYFSSYGLPIDSATMKSIRVSFDSFFKTIY